ncbi:MAG TPA: hypothetical protein VIY48_17775 [Candidatus Paceibacterota bacterium]
MDNLDGICQPDDDEADNDPMLCSPDDPDRFLSKYDLDDWSRPESYYGWSDDIVI